MQFRKNMKVEDLNSMNQPELIEILKIKIEDIDRRNLV
jgi:hypothetical protein